MRVFATLLVLTVLAALPAQAQISVPPGVGTLETAVNANTTPGQVFQLERGATYLLLERIDPEVDVVIEAAGEGDCPAVPSDCPLIQPAPAVGGGESDRPFQLDVPGISATLREVAMTNRNPAGQQRDRMIRLRAPAVTLRLERVLLFGENTMVVRVDTGSDTGDPNDPNDDLPGPTILVDGSIIKDVGNLDGNLDEGRFIDDRGNDMNRVSVTNSTFYHILNRVMRNDGGDLNELRFEYNTLHFVRRRAVEAGEVGQATVRNLMFVNVGFEGAGADETNSMIQLDSLNTGNDRHLVSHINWLLDPALIEETDGEIVLLNSVAGDANDGFEDTLTETPVTFTNVPSAFFDFTGEPFDYAYTPQITGSDGDPIGAISWFGLSVSNEPGTATAPATFRLDGAYPNPFSTQALVTYTLDAAAEVTLEVFDLLGRQVAVLDAGLRAAGEHGTSFDAATLPAGTYVVRLAADGRAETRKLTLLR